MTRNRRVMASLGERGKTLRLHESFRSAPRHVLVAIGVLFSSRSKLAREQAKAEIRRFIEAAVPPIRSHSARSRVSRSPSAADLPYLARLQEEFRRVNRHFFGNRLPTVPIRISGRMKRRNGQFSLEPVEIAISRTLCERGADGEAEQTLRHEMIHLWQWSEGLTPGHGEDFRLWANRLKIHPRATRTVCWSESEK